MRCYRKIVHISYKDHVTNKEVCAKIQQATGPHEDLLTIVKRYKLQWYGHVPHSSGLAKSILQGTVKGEEDKANRGIGGKTTSGNGQAWSLASPRGAVENREKWRKLVAKSVVPQRPSQLGADDNDDDDVVCHVLLCNESWIIMNICGFFFF